LELRVIGALRECTRAQQERYRRDFPKDFISADHVHPILVIICAPYSCQYCSASSRAFAEMLFAFKVLEMLFISRTLNPLPASALLQRR
jgi:hypothetical protein